MKLLVATKKLQGQRPNDFCWAKEGEIVHFGFECDGEAVDGRCGCRRALVGVGSGKAVTTFLVVDRKDFLPFPHLQTEIEKALKARGWLYKGMPEDLEKGMRDNLDYQTRELDRIASCFGVGDVIERRGQAFQKRGHVKISHVSPYPKRIGGQA